MLRILILDESRAGEKRLLLAVLAWAAEQSAAVSEFFCINPPAPIAALSKCREIPLAELSVESLSLHLAPNNFDLAIVSSKTWLGLDVISALLALGIPTIGPRGDAVALGHDRCVAKRLLIAANAPHADGVIVPVADGDEYRRAFDEAVASRNVPLVIKLSKRSVARGVTFIRDMDHAVAFAVAAWNRAIVGGCTELVIETALENHHIAPPSDTCLTILLAPDGSYLPLLPVHDALRNTGQRSRGITAGATLVSPSGWMQTAGEFVWRDRMLAICVDPLVSALVQQRMAYPGFLRLRMLYTPAGWKVIGVRHNLGGLEALMIFARLHTDIFPVLHALATEGTLHGARLHWSGGAAAAMVATQPQLQHDMGNATPLYVGPEHNPLFAHLLVSDAGGALPAELLRRLHEMR